MPASDWIEPGPGHSGQVRVRLGMSELFLAGPVLVSLGQLVLVVKVRPGQGQAHPDPGPAISRKAEPCCQDLPGQPPGQPSQVWALPDLDLSRQKPGPCHTRSGHSQAVQKRARPD